MLRCLVLGYVCFVVGALEQEVLLESKCHFSRCWICFWVVARTVQWMVLEYAVLFLHD